MAETIVVDIENLENSANNYALVTFPRRVKILSVTFTINQEAWGVEVDNRVWKLYCLASHPYVDTGVGYEWVWPIFGQSSKPIIERSSKLPYRSNTAKTGVYSASHGDPYTLREVHEGVLDAGDYLAIWVQLDSGDVEMITWEDTRSCVTIEYEESSRKSAYEEKDWWSWD